VNGATNGHAVNGNGTNGNGTNGNGTNGNGTNGHTTNGLLPVFGATDPPFQPDLPVVATPAEPEWGSFAGGIGDTMVNLTPSGFTWFNTKGATDQPTAPVPDQPTPGPASFTAVGLPRRVPRTHAVPSLVPPGSHRSGPVRQRADVPARNAANGEPAQRNPARARGFLNDYQAGIRQGQPGPGAENGQGEAGQR
jgi:hypothetical protein